MFQVFLNTQMQMLTLIQKKIYLLLEYHLKKISLISLELHSANPWQWNGEKKRYECPPSSIALRVAYTRLPTFFTTVYHNEVNDYHHSVRKRKSNQETLGSYVSSIKTANTKLHHQMKF